MPRAVRLIVPLLLLMALTGCLTDPFGVKPEVPGVKLPGKPAQTETAEPEPEPEASQP